MFYIGPPTDGIANDATAFSTSCGTSESLKAVPSANAQLCMTRMMNTFDIQKDHMSPFVRSIRAGFPTFLPSWNCVVTTCNCQIAHCGTIACRVLRHPETDPLS